LCGQHFWHPRRRRRISASLNTDRALNYHHPDPRQVSFLNAIEQISAGGILGFVHENEGGFTAGRNEATIQFAHFGGVASSETDRDFGWYVTER